MNLPVSITRGDRFRAARDVSTTVITTSVAPGHTGGGDAAVLPAGTVVITLDQVPGASAVHAYPENYDELETALVSAAALSAKDYSAYALVLAVERLADDFIALTPLDPRPPNRLPRG